MNEKGVNTVETMHQNTTAVPRTTTAATTSEVKTSRVFYIDLLRSALIILVVLHHVALVYGGIQPFYYLEPPVNNLAAFLVPMIFVLLNQAWFMGAFFMLAGYFTPVSFDRKGPGAFIKDRLIRLGIPLIFWIFVLNPISEIGFFLMPRELTGITTPLNWESFWQMYPDRVGLGPMWFVAMLLIFCIVYLLWRILTSHRTPAAQQTWATPRNFSIAVFILALAASSYLLRIYIPLGKSVMGFPTLAYLPQYLSFFVLGIIANRRDWLKNLQGSKGLGGFLLAVLVTLTLFPICFISFLKAIEQASPIIPPFGFGTWQSAAYALWDSSLAVGVTLGAITFFRRFFNTDGPIGRFLSAQSYAVYILHVPVIVYLAYWLRGIEINPLLKMGLVSFITVPTCFFAAFVIRKIPFVSKVV